jgi:Porin subfamily
MRNILLVIVVAMLPASVAPAEPSSSQKSEKAVAPARRPPLKGATGSNSCAAFGPGFVKVDGTDTCVKIGGAISIGAGSSSGWR